MKRLLCCALLVTMAFCAVAEEGLTPGAEAVPVQAAPVDPYIPREALDLALPAEAGAAANPEAEPDGAVANKTWKVYDWEDFISKANSAGNGDTIVIRSDISQGGKDSVCIDGKTVTLDLMYGSLTGSEASTAIGIFGNGGLTITGGKTIKCDVAVGVTGGCALTLRDVTIANCYNAGVDNKGTFTMESGGITDCGSVTGYGYGVYNWGSFTMKGGDITGNRTGVLNNGSFAMRGGWITGNGQGVHTVYTSDTAITVSGNVHIKGNTKYDVLVKKGQTVAVDGALHANAEIGITLSDDNLPGPGAPVVVTRGLRGNGTADNFIVWGDDYEKRINADGELEVALKVPGDPTLPAAPDYTLLAKLSASGNTAMKLKWTDVDGAEGYDVYFGKRGGRLKNVATVTGATSHKLSGLDRAEVYGAYVTAWVTEGGKKTAVGEPSPTVYAVAGGYDKHWCNPKSVSVKQSSLTLKAGKTAKIRASVAGVKAGRKVLREEKPLRYYSSNANVATVSSDGKVTAIAAGKCTIWAVANNGVRTGVKVRVK